MQQVNTEHELLSGFLSKFNGQVRIAPLAMNIHVLMRALADDDMTPKQLASVLHHYPVIAARLIALSNSAWVCPAVPITSIETACVRLGNSVVKGVSIAIAVASAFNVARCPVFDPIRFWTTAMLVAEGAALLANHLPNKAMLAADLEYTAQTGGILHNMGLLWLADNLAKETALALELTMESPLTVNQALVQRIGIDYCLVGAWIGKQWHMPDELIDVMAHHRNDEYQEIPSVPALLVGAAAKMVSAVFFGAAQMPDNEEIGHLGISDQPQHQVFKHIVSKFDSTRELAKALFL